MEETMEEIMKIRLTDSPNDDGNGNGKCSKAVDKQVVDKQVEEKKVDLVNHNEVNVKYIHLLKNVWIKYKDKTTGNVYSGGNLIECNKDTIVLRNIRQNCTTLYKDQNVFYCNNKNPIYETVSDIIIERQKLHVERVRLNEERIKLQKQFKNTKLL